MLKLTLSDEDAALLKALLEEERSTLPSLVHHATGGAAKEDMRARLRRVESLLERLRSRL
jgi:hypothetical protein